MTEIKKEDIAKVRAWTNLPVNLAIEVIRDSIKHQIPLEQVAEQYLQKYSKKMSVKLDQFAIGFNVVGSIIYENIAKIVIIGCGTDFAANCPEFKTYFSKILYKIKSKDDRDLMNDTEIHDMYQRLQAACQEPIKILDYKSLEKADNEDFIIYSHSGKLKNFTCDNNNLKFGSAIAILKTKGDFQNKIQIAQHIIGNDIMPEFVSLNDIAKETHSHMLEKFMTELKDQYPAEKIEMIAYNKCQSYFSKITLLEQTLFINNNLKIKEFINDSFQILDFIGVKT